ncbi:MAG TPA: TetR/AcrR family transcriptional regulator [Clostridiales bacterium]|jgi:AcrR family transcriptional regulator|nr:TetR/AcrR family transcriptional regulator [Clostridiales bacterium]
MATDRRIRYTKMVLRDSLIKLMNEKPISRISVKAICEEADINRATYYYHYRDPHDQLNQIEAEFIEGIEAFLRDIPETVPVDIVTKIFEYIRENRDLCCTLLKGDIAFEDKVLQLIRGAVFRSWNATDHKAGSLYDYIYTYTLSGSVGVVKKWLGDRTEKFTARDMAELVLNLTEKGIGGSLK